MGYSLGGYKINAVARKTHQIMVPSSWSLEMGRFHETVSKVAALRSLATLLTTHRLFALPLSSGLFLLSRSAYYASLALTSSSIKQFGLGSPMGQFLFGSWSGGNWQSRSAVVRDVFLANLPQLLLSIAQFWWTSLLTCMLAAREYDKFAAPKQVDSEATALHTKRRSLRVTSPKPGTEQESVSLPLRYGLLNLIIWTAIPWLASQAIFFAKIDVLDHWLYPADASICQVGYSVLGMILFVIVSFFTFVLAFYLGARRLSNQLPLAGTCSAAISAACHPSRPDVSHSAKKVLWGVEVNADQDQNGIRRCTFTSDEVFYPEEDELYA